MTAAKGVLRLALIQANPTVGAIDANLARALAYCESHKDADLIVFPECFASGYPLEDLVLRPGFLARVAQGIEGFAAGVRKLNGPAVLIGAPVAGANLPYNAAHFITPDGAIRTIVKTELPNDDVFDERRVFAQGRDPRPLDLNGWRVGAMICEDMWHGRVTRALTDELADFLIVINGSPYEIDKMPVRLAHARERVRTSGCPLIYLNMVGGQDELVLDGASFVLDEEGEIVAQMPAFTEATMRLELTRIGSWADNGSIEIRSIEQEKGDILGEVVRYPDSLESIYAACTLGLRDYIEKNGFPRAILGVSGGLDSALVAALAVDAIGADRVVGVMMPTRFTANESLDLATDLFQRLGCRHGVAPIGAMFDPYEKTLDSIGPELMGMTPAAAARSLTSENFQPRIRGALFDLGELPAPHPRCLADGTLQRLWRARALDRQQVRDVGRLRHALWRHVRRLQSDQGPLQDHGLRSLPLAQREPSRLDARRQEPDSAGHHRPAADGGAQARPDRRGLARRL
jgi:NAD+ synthase